MDRNTAKDAGEKKHIQCWCPNCGESHEEKGEVNSLTKLEDGRAILDCMGCAISRVWHDMRGNQC